MNGLIALVGSGEYLPVMEEVDRHLLASVNSNTPHVVCLPTAAGQEGIESINRWSRMGVEHFKKLGAEDNAIHIMDQDTLCEELLRSMVLGGEPEKATFQSLIRKYGVAEVERATNGFNATIDQITTFVADDARSYREYRHCYGRFGAGLTFFTKQGNRRGIRNQ